MLCRSHLHGTALLLLVLDIENFIVELENWKVGKLYNWKSCIIGKVGSFEDVEVHATWTLDDKSFPEQRDGGSTCRITLEHKNVVENAGKKV